MALPFYDECSNLQFNPEIQSSDDKSGSKDDVACDNLNPNALLNLLQRTGYSMTQHNGQRHYGGPPPGWKGPTPGKGKSSLSFEKISV